MGFAESLNGSLAAGSGWRDIRADATSSKRIDQPRAGRARAWRRHTASGATGMESSHDRRGPGLDDHLPAMFDAVRVYRRAAGVVSRTRVPGAAPLRILPRRCARAPSSNRRRRGARVRSATVSAPRYASQLQPARVKRGHATIGAVEPIGRALVAMPDVGVPA